MENFKITRDGKYDHMANIAMKIRNKLPIIEQSINNFFEHH